MKCFYLNTKNKKYNFVFGLCSIADGLVRVLSFGLINSFYQTRYAAYYARTKIKQFRQKNVTF